MLVVVVVVEIKTTDLFQRRVFLLFTQTHTYATCRLQLLNVKATRKLQATTIHDRLRHANA